MALTIQLSRSYASFSEVPWPVWVVIFAGAIIASTASSWQFWLQRMKGIRGRSWPTVSATIDLTSVQKRVEPGGKGPPIITYVVLLTYVYRNPEMQTGDYDREFGNEGEAKDWAAACKGRTVTVHVDPKDPANSVLSREELEAVVGQNY